MTPAQLAEIVEYTRSFRAAAEPLDVIVEGQTPGADAERDRALVEAYRHVGVTWWIEKLGWFRGPLAAMRARIEAGPPADRSAA